MSQINRRNLLLSSLALSLPVAAGCSSESVHDAVEELGTPTIETASVALRGYAIVACLIGPRVFALPAPGVRVLGVFLIVTSVATKLAIEYLDVELKKRYVSEALSEKELALVERELSIAFQLENGETETQPLGPNQYDEPAPQEGTVS